MSVFSFSNIDSFHHLLLMNLTFLMSKLIYIHLGHFHQSHKNHKTSSYFRTPPFLNQNNWYSFIVVTGSTTVTNLHDHLNKSPLVFFGTKWFNTWTSSSMTYPDIQNHTLVNIQACVQTELEFLKIPSKNLYALNTPNSISKIYKSPLNCHF